MLRRLLARFRGARSGGDDRSTQADRSEDGTVDRAEDGAENGTAEDAESGGFLRSRLDASVLYAHGQGNRQAEREIAALQEEQRLLEERERRRE